MKPELSKKTKALIDPRHTALPVVLSAFFLLACRVAVSRAPTFLHPVSKKFFALRKPSACLNQGLS